MQRLLLALSLVLGACSSNSSTAVDAAMADVAIDGLAPGSFGAPCTTVTDTSSECMGKACTNSFNQFPTPVCSQRCTMPKAQDPSCPTGSMGQFCNMQLYCRP